MKHDYEAYLAHTRLYLKKIEEGVFDLANNVDDEEAFHQFSIMLGKVYRDAYVHDYEYEDAMLTAYRDVRRAMPIHEDGKRYRTLEAYSSCN